MPFNVDIIKLAKANYVFPRGLATGPYSQVVVMSIPPGGDIGEEVHDDVDQTLVFVRGRRSGHSGRREEVVAVDRLVHVPAGTRHNFVNTGNVDLRLYTIYAPPEHKPGTIHKTKAEADAAHEGEH